MRDTVAAILPSGNAALKHGCCDRRDCGEFEIGLVELARLERRSFATQLQRSAEIVVNSGRSASARAGFKLESAMPAWRADVVHSTTP